VKTQLRTRTFLLCFLPSVALLASSFWIVQRLVQNAVRDELRQSLHQNQREIARIRAEGELQNSRFLKVAGENSALKAGIRLLDTNESSDAARQTVEDQLREMGEHMGFDLMLVSSPEGKPMAGVLRLRLDKAADSSQLVPLDVSSVQGGAKGLLSLGGRIFQAASVSVDQNDENLGALSVGQLFELSQQGASEVLMRGTQVVQSSIPVNSAELEHALASCGEQTDCALRAGGTDWIALRTQSFGDGYSLLSLANEDAVVAPIQARLQKLFISFAIGFTLVSLLCSIASSSSIVGPISDVVRHLRNAVSTGRLTALDARRSPIAEISELANIYNRAAVSVQKASEDLESAYLEFVGSLANALDARDPYTAGHSRRVSDLSCTIAAALQLKDTDVERVRIGALLHDIGKIGVADSVLQKPGALTAEEFDQVKQHPVIGRHILEGVQGFGDFLAAVELHHENWDGSGYPKGQSGTETPLDARIIHVADAYDAMTTDRAYRSGMTHERAIAILEENAAIQFDPEIVEVFVSLPRSAVARISSEQSTAGVSG
jgi:HD-GYP domain-containing protein (c-di-GMP phosphodiesterase class II)